MFINPKPYLIRASRFSALKGDTRAILLNKQEFKCTYCKNKLIEFDNLTKWSIECDDIIKNSINNLNITLDEGIINKYSTINLIDKQIDSTWYHGIHIDHVIPKSLAGSVKLCKILLDNNNNKMAIHNECHKLKTVMDQKLLISELQKIKKELRKKPSFRGDSVAQKKFVDMKAVKIITEDKSRINNYLKYINDIYGDRCLKESRALINRIKRIMN